MPAAMVAATRNGLVLVLALLLSGCLAGPDDGEGEDDASAPALFEEPVTVSDRWPGGEPVVAVAPDGTLYYEGIGAAQTDEGTRNMNFVWRSTDDGGNWTQITPPAVMRESTNDGFVAVGPDGSVFAANVFGLTYHVFRSTDQGENWEPLNVPRLPALMHRHWISAHPDGLVHMTVEALDPGAVPVLIGGPTFEDLPASPNRGFYHMVSEDNGDTWSVPQRIDESINYAGQSTMAVSADGQEIYVMRYRESGREPLDYTYEDGEYFLLASGDAGQTWQTLDAFPLVGTMGSALTSLVLDAGGRLSFIRSEAINGTNRVLIDMSMDGGSSWDRLVPELGSGSQAMPIGASAAPDTLGVLWYEADSGGLTGEIDATWHMRYARMDGLGNDSLAVTTADVSEPVHEGDICVAGPACTEREGDRRLLDYPWVAFGSDGRPHIAFASTLWDRPSAYPLYARGAHVQNGS